MSLPTAPDRAQEFRKRSAEVRAKADAMVSEKERALLLEIAETWERMAAYEEKHDLWRPSDPQ